MQTALGNVVFSGSLASYTCLQAPPSEGNAGLTVLTMVQTRKVVVRSFASQTPSVW